MLKMLIIGSKIHTNFNAKINTVKVDFFVGFSNTVGINSK